jgi:hypothetical protein
MKALKLHLLILFSSHSLAKELCDVDSCTIIIGNSISSWNTPL